MGVHFPNVPFWKTTTSACKRRLDHLSGRLRLKGPAPGDGAVDGKVTAYCPAPPDKGGGLRGNSGGLSAQSRNASSSAVPNHTGPTGLSAALVRSVGRPVFQASPVVTRPYSYL